MLGLEPRCCEITCCSYTATVANGATTLRSSVAVGMVSCVESLCEMNAVLRSLSFSSHDVAFSSADAEEHLQRTVDVASLRPRCGLAAASLLSVPQLAALALSSAEPKTGGLSALSVLTHISCPKCLERQLKMHQDNRSREDEEELGQTA